MNPVDRGLLFIATVGVGLIIAKETQAVLAPKNGPKGFEAAYETGKYLIDVAVQLLSSVFAAGIGSYITDVVGGDASTRPVYTLLLCTTIVGLLFLGRRALEHQ